MSNTQMLIRLDSNTKNKLRKFAQSEGKNTSQVVRELIEKYIQNRDMNNYIDDLWEKIGKKLKANNVTQEDVEKAIKDVRSSH